MWQEVLVTMALVSAVMCDTTVSADDDGVTGTGMPMTTEEPITEFALIINHMESSTSSIKFKWEAKVPKWMKVQSYAITASQVESEAVMTYPALPGHEDSFEAEDLVKDSIYDVCITSEVMNDTESLEFRDCFESFTIPYIRPDSVYVLVIVVFVFTLLIMIGYCSWRRDVAKAEAAAAAAAEAEEEENEGKKEAKIVPEEQKPILLSSPSDDRPKSSIEDEDIPYITPPWSEIEREESEKRAAANSFSHV